MKEFTEKTWRNKFRKDFSYMDGDAHMPGGEKWEVMEYYIQDLIDKAMMSRVKVIIEGLEILQQFETNSLKKGIKSLRKKYGC